MFSSTVLVSLLLNISVLQKILPLESEKLSTPVKLSGACSAITIQEWQNEPSEKQKELKTLNSVCHLVHNKIELFYFKNKKKCHNLTSFRIFVSLLNPGKNPRELNDLKFRFLGRKTEKDSNGNYYPLLGYFDFSTKHLFILNDFQHSKFKTIWAHELFHAINHHCGFFDNVGKEEQEARKFTKYLDLGE